VTINHDHLREVAFFRALTRLYTDGYKTGHHHTVEAIYTDVYRGDAETYFFDEVREILDDEDYATVKSLLDDNHRKDAWIKRLFDDKDVMQKSISHVDNELRKYEAELHDANNAYASLLDELAALRKENDKRGHALARIVLMAEKGRHEEDFEAIESAARAAIGDSHE